jgi:hypothetical protein
MFHIPGQKGNANQNHTLRFYLTYLTPVRAQTPTNVGKDVEKNKP